MIGKILHIALSVFTLIVYLIASVAVWRRITKSEYGCWATYRLLMFFAPGMFVCYTLYLIYKIAIEIGKAIGWLFGYRDID